MPCCDRRGLLAQELGRAGAGVIIGLIALAMVAALCLVLAILAAWPEVAGKRIGPWPCLGWCCCAGMVPPLLNLVAAAPPVVLVLPLGPPVTGAGGLSFGIDHAGAMLLLLTMIAGFSASLYETRRPEPGVLLLLVLAALASDSTTLAIALGLLVLMMAARGRGLAMVCAALCAVGTAPGAASFALLRQMGPVSGAAAVLVPLLAVLLLLWTLAAAATRGRRVVAPALALLGALCLVLRLPDDVWVGAEAGLPVCSSIIIATGLALGFFGAWRGLRARDLRLLWRMAIPLQLGLVCVAVGLAVAARAASLPSVAAAASDGAWLLAVAAVLTAATSDAAVEVIALQAGQTRLDRLGGLIRQMPFASVSLIAAGCGVAGLPPLLGFAALWLLGQALLAGPFIGGFTIQTLLAVLLAATGALQGAAIALALRGVVPALLGRPRTPRGAAAEDVAPVLRWSTTLPAGLLMVTGLVPGAVLALLGRSHGRSGGFGLSAPSGAVYAPLPLVLIAAVAVGLAVLGLRHPAFRPGRPPAAEVVAWEEGAPPPPPWLPFGDPETQQGADLLRPPPALAFFGRVLWRARPAWRWLRRGFGPWYPAAVAPAAGLLLALLLLLWPWGP